MSSNGRNGRSGREQLALAVLWASMLALLAVAIVAIAASPGQGTAASIFNMTLPVVAAWVGAALAFHFGKAYFESANQQVRDIVQALSPLTSGHQPVQAVMRRSADTRRFRMESGKEPADYRLQQIANHSFSDEVSRAVILDATCAVRYLIHRSSMDRYVGTGASMGDTLEVFLTAEGAARRGYGIDGGFVVVAKNTLLRDAKQKMESIGNCQDIVVTEHGSASEPMLGWISNARLMRLLE